MSLETHLSSFAVRRPYLTVAAVLLFVAVCTAIIAVRIKVDTDILNLLPQRFPSVRALKIYDRDFSQSRELTFGLWDEKHTTDLDAFSDHFAEALRNEPWVVRVLDRSPMESPEGMEELQILAVPLLLNMEPAEFSDVLLKLQPEAIRERLAHQRAAIEAGSPKAEMEMSVDPLGVITPALKQLAGSFSLDTSASARPLAAPDGTLRVVVVVTNQKELGAYACQETMRKVEEFKKRVIATWPGPAPEILTTGRTAYVSEISEHMRYDIISTIISSVFLVAGVFYFGFRRVRPLAAILAVLLLCCLAAVAAGTLIFRELNVITMGLCSILVGLGVDFGMLLYGTYQTSRNLGKNHEAAAAESIRQLGRGVVFGAATTAAAFVALWLSESPGFTQLGTLIAVGILFAAFFMMTAFFVFVGRRNIPGKHDFFFTATQSYVDRLFTNAKPVLFSTLALLIALNLYAYLPVGTVQFKANPASLQSADSKAAFAMRTITEKVPGAAVEPVLAIITGSTSEDFHTQWTKAEQHWLEAKQRGEIKNFTSPAAFVLSPKRETANIARLGQCDFASATTALREALATEGFNAQSFKSAFGTIGSLEKLAHHDLTPADWHKALPAKSSWRFILDRFLSNNTGNVGAAYILPNATITSAEQQQQLRAALETPGVEAKLSGWSYVMADLRPWSRDKLIELSVVMIVFNIILLVFIYRAIAPLLVLLASMGLSIGAMIAGLKITGLSLNLFNVLAFPLVLGVGVDYGIYVIIAVREAAHRQQANARHYALAAIVKPILLSGLTAIAGFASLGLAYNPALSSLGLVCALGVACCLFSTLFLILPAYLWRGYK